MKRVLFYISFVVICFLFQCTVFQTWALANVSPNLLVVMVSSVGFMRGKKEGMFVGLFSGLLCDICYGELFGFYTLVYMYIGYINGYFQTIFYDEDIKLPLVLITVSEVVYGLVIYGFMFALRNRTHFLYYLRRVIIPELIYTLVVTMVLYRLIMIVNRKLELSEKRSAG